MHWHYSHARTLAAKSTRKSSFLTVVVAEFFRWLHMPFAAPRRTGSCPTLFRVGPRYLCLTSLFIRISSPECSVLSQGARAAVEGRSKHSEIARDLRCCLSTFYESAGVADLAVVNSPRAAAPTLVGVGALGDGADYAFLLVWSLICPNAAMIVNSMNLIGVAVLTSPPQRLSTPRRRHSRHYDPGSAGPIDTEHAGLRGRRAGLSASRARSNWGRDARAPTRTRSFDSLSHWSRLCKSSVSAPCRFQKTGCQPGSWRR
jgi:hypothetical protein